MAAKLSNGNYRGRVRDPRTGKQIAIHQVIGGPRSYRTLKEREQAREQARQILEAPEAHLTVRGWWNDWTRSDAWGRLRGRSPETVNHNTERTTSFVEVYGDQTLRSINRQVANDWIADPANLWTVPAIRAMFNDAERAGKIPPNTAPFNKLGLAKRTRVGRRLPARADIDRMHLTADDLTPPSFAAYLFTVGWQGIRPGEGDALRWDRLDFENSTMMIDQQWSAKGCRFKEPKHDSVRKLPMVPVVRDRLLDLPRDSEFVFTTVRGTHYTPSSRNHHWNRVRCTLGLGDMELYIATRHFFVTYAIEQLDLSVDDIGWYCGHRSAGGRIVRDHYLHPDDQARRERIAKKFELIEHDTGQRSLDGRRARTLHSV